MKIVIGTESFAPNVSGVAIFAEKLADFLSGLGHDVYVFAPSASKKTYVDQDYDRYSVIRIGSIANPFRHSHRITLRPYGEIRKRLDKIRPDIIHLQTPTSISAALLKVANESCTPVVITHHFSMEFVLSYVKSLKFLHPLISRLVKWYVRRFYNKCTLITTPSETAKDKIKSWGFRPRIKVLSNGIDMQCFSPPKSVHEARSKLNLPQKPVVLYSGRIDKDKSVDVLVRAIPLVLKKVDAQFVFMGSGEKLEETKRQIKKFGLEDRVTFLGWIDHDSPVFPLAYQASTLFVSASVIEIQSIVMLEALASGLPIVAAKAGSFPEFVVDNKNGYLFKPRSHKEMAEKIIKVLSDADLCKKLSRGALETAKPHAVNDCLFKFLDLYKEILAG